MVADNGSADGSADVARQYGARVVDVPRRGFGTACHAGLLAATDDVCFLDADASLDPADLPRLTAVLTAGDAELALGRRTPRGRGAWPVHARVGNAVLAASLRRRTGYPVRDLGPMRVVRREPLLALDLADRRFGYPLEMVLRAADAGWRVAELPVDYRPRVGRSKVTGTVRGTARSVRDMRRVLAS